VRHRPKLGLALASALLAGLGGIGCGAPTGEVSLRVVDPVTGKPIPARVELTDASGNHFAPIDALPVVRECAIAPLPQWASLVQEAISHTAHIDNLASGTRQFYLDRPLRFALPAGSWRIRASHGIETRLSEASFEVEPGEPITIQLDVERWIDQPARGWYGADDHIHLTRRTEEEDARIGRWMQAEDLHVANLLQMGTARQFGVTPQRAFGDAGASRHGTTLLLSGQEHPRTNVFGHTITLGAREAIDLRESYTHYRSFWEEARRLGGIPGYAHWGLGPGRDGLAINAPTGLVGFVEVLQFEYPGYEVWYELLDQGFRISPTAGTDFPCGPSGVPGRERFYTRVEGPLDRESWLEGIRRGRTFVTNGPMLEFSIDDAKVGDEVVLAEPGTVRIAGVVRFDPARDDVQRLAIVRGGEVIASTETRSAPGQMHLEIEWPVEEAGWFALRADGDKVGEAAHEPVDAPGWALALGARIANGVSFDEREAHARERALRHSAAHTAPIYLRVEGRPSLAESPAAREHARKALERLDAIEARFAEERIEEYALWPFEYSDGIPEDQLRVDRPAVLRDIEEARNHYRAVAR
jgi:hypothetical protein